MIARMVTCACLFFAVCGCSNQQKVTVTELSAALMPQDITIVVDGEPYEDVWQRAVVLPFEPTGKAMFLCDRNILYGYINNYEHQKWGFASDEQVCVSVRSGDKTATLTFEELWSKVHPGKLALREATIIDRSAEIDYRRELPSSSVTTASRTNTAAQQGYSWTVEFSLDLDCLVNDATSGQTVYLGVYRIMPQRVSNVLKIKLPGRED